MDGTQGFFLRCTPLVLGRRWYWYRDEKTSQTLSYMVQFIPFIDLALLCLKWTGSVLLPALTVNQGPNFILNLSTLLLGWAYIASTLSSMPPSKIGCVVGERFITPVV